MPPTHLGALAQRRAGFSPFNQVGVGDRMGLGEHLQPGGIGGQSSGGWRIGGVDSLGHSSQGYGGGGAGQLPSRRGVDGRRAGEAKSAQDFLDWQRQDEDGGGEIKQKKRRKKAGDNGSESAVNEERYHQFRWVKRMGHQNLPRFGLFKSVSIFPGHSHGFCDGDDDSEPPPSPSCAGW